LVVGMTQSNVTDGHISSGIHTSCLHKSMDMLMKLIEILIKSTLENLKVIQFLLLSSHRVACQEWTRSFAKISITLLLLKIW
jgi:hypothetical protein